MTHHGFKRSDNEPTLHIKSDKNAVQLVVSLYVDDMLVIGSEHKFVTEFNRDMQLEFEMSDLGIMKYFWVWKSIKRMQEFSLLKRNMLLMC